MAECNLSQNRNWIRLTGEEEIFVNCVCCKCNKILMKEFNAVLFDSTAKILCDQCTKSILKEYKNAKHYDHRQFNKEFVCSLLDMPNVVKFIEGNNLYIAWFIMVKNYREKIEFCNM